MLSDNDLQQFNGLALNYMARDHRDLRTQPTYFSPFFQDPFLHLPLALHMAYSSPMYICPNRLLISRVDPETEAQF